MLYLHNICDTITDLQEFLLSSVFGVAPVRGGGARAHHPSLDLLIRRDDKERAERGVARGEKHSHVGHHRRHPWLRQHVDPDHVIDAEEHGVQHHQHHHRLSCTHLHRGPLRAAEAPHRAAVPLKEDQDVAAGAQHHAHEGEVAHRHGHPVNHVGQVIPEIHVAEAQVERERWDGAVSRGDGEERGGDADGHVEEPQRGESRHDELRKPDLQTGEPWSNGGRLEDAQHAGDADRQRSGHAVHVDDHLTPGVVQQVPQAEDGHDLRHAAGQQ